LLFAEGAEEFIHDVPVRRAIRRIRDGFTSNAGAGRGDVLKPAKLLSVASAPILESITDG
jgi:hypothetical protein